MNGPSSIAVRGLSWTRSGLGRPLPSLIRSSSRRGRDRLDDIRCAPVINSLSPRAASVVSPWAAQPVAIPTSATIVAPNSAFVIARTTTIVIPRSRRQAGADDTGTVTVRSPPVVSTGNAQGGNGRPIRACALSTDRETPRCSDQLNESNVAHAKAEVAIAILPGDISFMAFLHYCAPCYKSYPSATSKALRHINARPAAAFVPSFGKRADLCRRCDCARRDRRRIDGLADLINLAQ